MKKNKVILACVIVVSMLAMAACDFEKVSKEKTNDIDFTVVAEIEMPKEVKQIVEERKEKPFKVTYTDNQYTYIIVGYGKQNYAGYSIKVKEMYETKNAICVKTLFEGPKEYSNKEEETYPFIVIKIEYTDKNVVFSE